MAWWRLSGYLESIHTVSILTSISSSCPIGGGDTTQKTTLCAGSIIAQRFWLLVQWQRVSKYLLTTSDDLVSGI